MIRLAAQFDVGSLSAPSAEQFPRLADKAGRLPLLVCGVAGVAGLNALAYFRQRYGPLVTGQRPRKNWPLRGKGIVGFDLENTRATRKYLIDHQIRTVLNTGGSCALKNCELDPAMAWRVNVECVDSLLRAMEGLAIRFVHLSIDLVFSGTRGGDHREDDPTDPVTVYGKTMVEAEKMILARRPDACVARISLPMGISFNGHAGAIDWIQSRFAKGKPATLYYDEIRTPTYVDCLNEIFEELIASDRSGIVHAGGPRKLSLNEIAQIVNVVGGYDPKLLRGCYRMEAGPVPPRAGDVSLDSSRLSEALGRPAAAPWPYFDELVPTDRDWHYRRSFEGSPELIREILYRRPSPGTTLSTIVNRTPGNERKTNHDK